MQTPQYFLSKSCFVCRAQSYWVILNSATDRYQCLGRADLALIGSRLHGWSDADYFSVKTSRSDNEEKQLIDSLLDANILTAHSCDGKLFKEVNFFDRVASIEPNAHNRSANPSARDLMTFFMACARTDVRLRRGRLFRHLSTIGVRRNCVDAPDLANALTLVNKFRQLRPVYPRNYLCLFDSLALHEFLWFHNFYASVIFGVIAEPFQAHCWLQKGSTVLDDDLERVRRFQPIYCV